MTLKTYRAESMAAALSKVKRDLGGRAVILSTKTVKQGGILGVGSRTVVEITAGDDKKVLPTQQEGDTMKRPSGNTAPVGLAKGVAMPGPVPTPPTPDSRVVQQELQDIKVLVQDLVRHARREQCADLPEELRQTYVRLIQNEVAEELAGELIQQLSRQNGSNRLKPATIREFLTRQIARIVAPACPIKVSAADDCRVVAVVGATGVGKTTTVAKLAAHFRLREHKKVGLVTIDTYRIAAVDQLRTYAKIIQVPLEVVLTPQELQQALKRLKDCDVVFIDTAGRSQFDTPRLDDLRQFLEAAKPDETHLVLSANCSAGVLQKAVEKFSSVRINRVIFSKMDEAVGVGTLLSVMQKLDARLSYITTGQDVPDDIEVGDGRQLARMILDTPDQAAN